DAEIRERLTDAADRGVAEKVANYGAEVMRSVEKSLLLQLLDQVWKEHLLMLDHLRQGIGLRAYAQRDPLNEYKRESFNMFEDMLNTLRERVTQVIAHIELQVSDEDGALMFQREQQEMTETREDPALSMGGGEPEEPVTAATPIRSRQASGELDANDPSTWGRVARNQPCPCGSGKKYKQCHGKI
ncbi:MAG: preprotein translocase subunit SecA, partial [Rhodospirillaceae bacterium]|nr:preprotein translocase subunit SecA [Rhodospirillaceae bacterium]